MSDLNQADYVLEQWARWSLSCNGFPETSAIANLLEVKSRNKHQPLPVGVDSNNEVAVAIRIFQIMLESDKSASNRQILQTFLLERINGESIRGFCERTKYFSRDKYYVARNEFSLRLDTYYSLVEHSSIKGSPYST